MLNDYLLSRGLTQFVIDDLLPYISEDGQQGFFWDKADIMNPCCFCWPGQKRFVVVGNCPNGDGIAIDTENEMGAIFYLALALSNGEQPWDEVAIKVADSPSDWISKIIVDDFPYDYYDAFDSKC